MRPVVVDAGIAFSGAAMLVPIVVAAKVLAAAIAAKEIFMLL